MAEKGGEVSMHSLGAFIPAIFSIPENLVRAAMGLQAIVNGIYYAPGNGVIEDILARRAMAAELAKNPVGLSGCGPSTCPCQVGLCGPGLAGLGGTLDDVLNSVTSGSWGTYAVIGGATVLALLMFSGGGSTRRDLRASRAEYKAGVAKARAKYRREVAVIKSPREA